MRIHTAGVVFAVVALGAASGTVSGQQLQAKDLPPAVRAAVAAETAGATLQSVSTKIVDGRTVYEVRTTRNGTSADLLFDAAGALLPPAPPPAPVVAPPDLTAAAPAAGAAITESLTPVASSSGRHASHRTSRTGRTRATHQKNRAGSRKAGKGRHIK